MATRQARPDRMRLSRRAWLAGLAALPCGGAGASANRHDDRTQPLVDRGAIVRGPRDRRRLALVFTGDRYAEGAPTIFDALRRREIRAACFLTGRFLRDPDLRPVVERARDDGHDLGPHGDQHLLYASWDRPPKTLVSRGRFLADLAANERALAAFGPGPARFPYFLPAYEHYTEEIARWTEEAGRTLINLTRGTLSHTDYMKDDEPRFVPADRIVASILAAEQSDPDGLSGYLLLMHLGAGIRRSRDHPHDHLGGLLDEFANRGYRIVRIPELLNPTP